MPEISITSPTEALYYLRFLVGMVTDTVAELKSLGLIEA